MNKALIITCLIVYFKSTTAFPNVLNYRDRGMWLFSHMVDSENTFKPSKTENDSFLLELSSFLGIPNNFEYSTLAAAKFAQDAWHMYQGKTAATHENNAKGSKRTNLMELAKQLNLTILIDKLKKAGIDDVLDHEGPFTLFAPTNEAFNNRPGFCDNVAIQDLMKYHVVRGAFKLESFKNNQMLPSLLNFRSARMNLYQNNKVVTANGRQIAKPDNIASNGVLHVLHDVMCAVYVGNAGVEINRCPTLRIFSQAINATNLNQLVNGPHPLTVFVPTDSAFKNLPPGVLDKLFKNTTLLTDVVLYHIVPDVWYTLGMQDGQVLKSYQGNPLNIDIQGKSVKVNNATINLADATVGNGVVHSIDTVLLPPHYEI